MKVSLITGASSGIGRSLARRIASEGHAVALIARRKHLLDTLVDEIECANGRALAIECDVTDRKKVLEAVRKTEAVLGPIDRLVANAGGGERTSVDPFEASHIKSILALNVMGAANCIEAVLPGMLERGAGHIVAISSLAAYRGLPRAAGYGAAKAALTNMMESLMIDLRPFGISVSIILPGFVRTKPKRRKNRLVEVELDDATAKIHRAILLLRRRYAFPFALVLAVGLGRILPAVAYEWLLSRHGRSQTNGTR
jgi:short-subunit dehydrogenase